MNSLLPTGRQVFSHVQESRAHPITLQSHLKNRASLIYEVLIQPLVAIRGSMGYRITMKIGIRMCFLGMTLFNPKITFSLQTG